jgi:hypothetical protein
MVYEIFAEKIEGNSDAVNLFKLIKYQKFLVVGKTDNL